MGEWASILNRVITACRLLWPCVILSWVVPSAFWLLQNPKVAFSLLLGITLWVLPQVCFLQGWPLCLTCRVPAKMVCIFYWAGFVKWIFGGGLFILMVKMLSIDLLPILVGYIIVQVIFWVYILVLSRRGI